MSAEELFPTAEETLSPQFGSNLKTVKQQEIDERKLSKINDIEAIVIAYFNRVPMFRGGRYAKAFFKDYLVLKESVNGWRANQIIQLVGA